jgi:hypothetical protein
MRNNIQSAAPRKTASGGADLAPFNRTAHLGWRTAAVTARTQSIPAGGGETQRGGRVQAGGEGAFWGLWRHGTLSVNAGLLLHAQPGRPELIRLNSMLYTIDKKEKECDS